MWNKLLQTFHDMYKERLFDCNPSDFCCIEALTLWFVVLEKLDGKSNFDQALQISSNPASLELAALDDLFLTDQKIRFQMRYEV